MLMTPTDRWQAAKDKVAKKYNRTMTKVKMDFEYGMGISKMMSEDEFYQQAAELYAQSVAEDAYNEGYRQGSMRSKKSAEQFKKEYFKP